jgi:glyoxylase-like metal-dependent hydrolase (beta-lactamase superfamily II)
MAREVAPGIWVQNLLWSNVVWVRGADAWTLIDAGPPGSAGRLLRTHAGCLEPLPLLRVLVTHAHPDHVGGAAALRAACGGEVWGPELERAWIEHPELGGPPRPPGAHLSWAQRWLAKLPVAAPQGVPLARGLRPGEGLDEVRAGMSVINLAGHTPGQIGFWLPQERVAIVGDALMHLLPWLHPPFAAFTSDMRMAERSVARLVALGPRVLIPGHGPPLVAAGEGDLAQQLRRAQARFAARSSGAAEPLLPPASRV